MPIHRKSTINRIIAWLHLWLGLLSGIVVFVVSITGCLFAFQEEITAFLYRKKWFIPEAYPQQALPFDQLFNKAQSALGAEKPIDYAMVYRDSRRAWEFTAYEPGNESAISFPGSIAYYESVFVNPYTGDITGRMKHLHEFFTVVKYIHWSLFLNERYGQPIVGWSTVIFTITLITGFIMWFPGKWSRHELRRAFTIRWQAKWKRINYDLHNVLGFYVLFIALILAFTGMVFSFAWIRSLLQGNENNLTAKVNHALLDADPGKQSALSVDRALATVMQHYPEADRYLIYFTPDDHLPHTLTVYHQKHVFYDMTTFDVDPQAGNLLWRESFDKLPVGEKLLSMNYDIHVGAIAGLPGKVLAFGVSLVCASLPVTGFLIWWGKKRKLKKSSSQVMWVREKETGS